MKQHEARRAPTLMMDDLMTGIDTVVKMGVADPDRMCLYGFSNGGGATNMIVTRTTRFKCAVSASGAATDITSSFFMLGDPETYVKMTGGRTPWDDPETYIKLSPIYHLDKVTTPMLLAAGDEETAGALISMEMYTGLRYLGRHVTFLRYPRSGPRVHGGGIEGLLAASECLLRQISPSRRPAESA
jgi:dipeptidyl aminopeptidase/acylaminoacyl peptidase